MDNNTADVSQRGPVVGRKNYYGSGSVWSGRLAAMTFSLFQTLCLWGLNPRLWFSYGLPGSMCQSRRQGGRRRGPFMPWNLSPEQKRDWGCEDEVPTSDTSYPKVNAGHELIQGRYGFYAGSRGGTREE